MNRRAGLIAVALTATLGASTQFSGAQSWPPGPGAPPPAAQSQVCQRLEAQLGAVDRGAGDPAQSEQIRRYEESASRQQAELDRVVQQSRRAGCDSGFFLFRSESPQCVELNRQVQTMRGNLDRMTMDLQRLRGGTLDRGEQRRGILVALSENNCGPQYRQAARGPGGFFEQVFGNTTSTPNDPNTPMGNGFRTVCVRTCDGFYFPISYSTSQEHFRDDEKTCQRMCPASEVALFSHRNPGEDMNQAVSLGGAPYTGLPNAFRYRSAFDPQCTCKRPGQSWAEALGPDTTVQSGDIVVTDERAKQLSAPPAAKQPQAKGRPPAAAPAPPAQAAAAPAAEPPADTTPDTTGAKRPVRAVGPTFIPPTANPQPTTR